MRTWRARRGREGMPPRPRRRHGRPRVGLAGHLARSALLAPPAGSVAALRRALRHHASPFRRAVGGKSLQAGLAPSVGPSVKIRTPLRPPSVVAGVCGRGVGSVSLPRRRGGGVLGRSRRAPYRDLPVSVGWRLPRGRVAGEGLHGRAVAPGASVALASALRTAAATSRRAWPPLYATLRPASSHSIAPT